MGNGRICCVPLCPSKTGTPGISFHEIPSNLELRQKWLTVISRRDAMNPNKSWIPGSRSAACSRHFLDSDYVANHQQRRLKKDAVPSIFPEYPSHKLPTNKIPRKSLSRNLVLPFKKRRLEKDVDYACKLNTPPEETSTTIQTDPQSESIKIIAELHKKLQLMKTKVNNLSCAVRRKDKIILSMRQEQGNLKKNTCHLQGPIEKLKEDAAKGEVKALILLQQIEAYGKCRFRWSEICLRMCVLWKSKSPRAYKFARRHFVNLPSRSTLGNYIGPSNLETGFTQLVTVRLKEEFKNHCEIDRMCSLIFDEMSIKPMLQYRKQADKIIGRAQFGKGSNLANGCLANHLLCFVLKGLASNYRIPVAYYLVAQLQGNDLSSLILNVISEVEKIGFQICRLVCDDATTNVKALATICGGSLQHQIKHPVRSQDPLFISFDPCHIIKNVRNQFLDDERNLNYNNKTISSKPIKILYENQKMLPIKPVRFLTRKSLYPTNFEKMNVKRAIQIFSPEVIAALEFCKEKNLSGFLNIDGTLEFMKFMQKWFLIHNVCNTTHYIRSRDENRMHFGMVDDSRLDWLQTSFLGYIDSWKEYSSNVTSTSNRKSKTQCFLTNETYNAIKITTLSTIGCVTYLLKTGFHFVLTRKFNSDDIEGIFSAIRSSQGRNDQANAVGSIYAIETILKTGLFSCSCFGNSAVSSNDTVSVAFAKRNAIGSVMPVGNIIQLNREQQALAAKLGDPPQIHNVTTKVAGISMVAGFLLRLLKCKHSCPEGVRGLTGTQDDAVNKIIQLQDRGGLHYPSTTFVAFVKLVFDILHSGNHYCYTEALVKSWTVTLISLIPDNMLDCSCGNFSHTTIVRKIIITSLCKIYFTNVCFNATNFANEKPKFQNKSMSKKVKKL